MRDLKYQARFEFFVVTVLGVAFAWIALTVAWAAAYQGFWIDELYTLHAINLPFSEMVKERAQRGHPPLFFILEKVFVSLPFLRILTPEMQLRLFPYCCWLGAILAFTKLGKKFFPPTALQPASVVFAFSQIALPHAANARMYSLALLLAVLHTYSLLALYEARFQKWSKLTYLLSGVLGVMTTPTFFLFTGTTVIVSFARRTKAPVPFKLCLLTLATATACYAPVVISYLQASYRWPPVSKHISRIYLCFLSLLTGTGRGKVPEGGFLDQAIFSVSVSIGIALLMAMFVRRQYLSNRSKLLFWLLVVPFLIHFGLLVLSFLPGLSRLRFGTDRYIVVLVPAGALLTGSIVETVRSIQARLLTTLFLAALSFATFRSHVDSEGRYFVPEIRQFCHQYQSDKPVIVVPTEIVDGLRLYCPAIQNIESVDVCSCNQRNIERILDTLRSSDSVYMIYYRGHCPDVIARAKETYSTFTLLSRKVYGSEKDPIFGIYVFSHPRLLNNTMSD